MADQKKLMEIQQQNQMALNKQSQQLAQENWDYTNAENQVKHYENAGLNVGLMYGGNGAGGTLSSGSGGGAAGGSAPIPESVGGQLGMIGIQTQQMINQTELIKDGAPLIYTERKDGVQAGYNIKTDRWEVAVEAMDKVAKTKAAQRENRAKMEVVKDNVVEPIQGTNSDGTNE